VSGDRVDRQQDPLHRATPRKWARQSERDGGVRPGSTTAEQVRIKELEREVRVLRKSNEIPKLASAYFAQAEFDRQLKK
jgi:transposase